MKKYKKVSLSIGIIAGMLITSSMTAFAGTWKTGTGANQNKWWYDNGNGTYTSNGWQWIDGNNDGIAECYYFDASGWMLFNTTTPDGYQVGADGAWRVNGVIQTKPAETKPAETKPAETQAPVQETQAPTQAAETGDKGYLTEEEVKQRESAPAEVYFDAEEEWEHTNHDGFNVGDPQVNPDDLTWY